MVKLHSQSKGTWMCTSSTYMCSQPHHSHPRSLIPDYICHVYECTDHSTLELSTFTSSTYMCSQPRHFHPRSLVPDYTRSVYGCTDHWHTGIEYILVELLKELESHRD